MTSKNRTEGSDYPRDYTARVRLTAALRRGFEAVLHHEKLTKRVLPAFERALSADPQARVYYRTDGLGGVTLEFKAWGEQTSVYMFKVTDKGASWTDDFAKFLAQVDPSKDMARQAKEVTKLDALRKLDAQVRALRERADELVNEATGDDSGPSYGLRDMFPALFKGEV